MTAKLETNNFEFPLNEHMRICLRLENLFIQINHNIETPTVDSSRIAITSLLQILDILDRPDLKSKLAQMLTQQASTLAQLEQFPQVNTARLKEVLSQLDRLIGTLHNSRNKIGDPLRNNEFLNNIRLQLGNPGGICSYKSPAYALWLNQAAESRIKDLKAWLREFNDIQDITNWVLKLTRESTTSQKVTCDKGFYSQALESNNLTQLVRLNLPAKYNIFPEIIASKFRITIRFLTPHFQDGGRSTPFLQPFDFELACCRF